MSNKKKTIEDVIPLPEELTILLTPEQVIELAPRELPDVIKILHKDFALRERDYRESFGNHRLAEINFMSNEINYLPLANSEVVDSIIHEVLHGIFGMFDIGASPEDEEHIVFALATGLTTIMRDNPDLMPALQGMLD